ncbi:MAG: tetratricopeptide repeat protein [Planctomycetota bacterium]
MHSISILRNLSVLALAALWLAAPAVRAQDLTKDEQTLTKQCVKALSRFATKAKSKKVGPRAKQAYDLVLEYDPENRRARSELGFRKVKDVWVNLPPEKRKKWRDKAKYEDRYTVLEDWADTAIQLSKSHTTYGSKLKAAGKDALAMQSFQKAIYYNPNNEEANLAVGHKKGEGFYGTDAQITFAKRMKEIEVKAVEFARKEYSVEELGEDKMPVEIRNLIDQAPEWMLEPSFEVHGAKSGNFTVWCRGSQDLANDCAMWAERTVEFMVWLIGEKAAKRYRFVERSTGRWGWQGFLATNREREEFLKANPQILDGRSPKEAMQFANNTWRSPQGLAVMKVGTSPRRIHDALISYVVMDGLCLQRNDGVGQGIIHAVTWYLKATSISKWGAIPEGTVGEDSLNLPEGTNWWMRTIRDQAVSNQDWAMAQVPRERLARFRNDCRLKTWSLMTWMFAAYPEKWLSFYLGLPDADKKVPTLEEVEEVVVATLGKSSEKVDAEWREWARGDSGVAYGTGYGPPLLPERPSDIELTALEQVNLVRMQEIGYTWKGGGNMTEGSWVTLSECEMDAETSIGCDLHARYVTNHPELSQDTDMRIHEEDPAHEDFTRQGQQSGGGNIIWSTGRATKAFAKDSIDGWISAIYHRLPMLRHNIKRLGYAHFDNGEYSVSVLDMSSLEEPYDPGTAPRLVAWPGNNAKNVPTHFGDPEMPNPLADQPEGEQDITKCGYVVSLQLMNEVSRILGECDIELWESRKGGRPPAKNFVAKGSQDFTAWTSRCRKEVECYKHTPKVPLNKKRDQRDVLFAIPKDPLDRGKAYQARAYLQLGGADTLVFIWEFTTGSQKEGLKLKKKK